MTIAREEIFGPALSIVGYRDEADAITMANDTPYGLAGYVSSGNVERARKVAQQLRAGNGNLNGVPNDRGAPFGGYKRSGNGREWGRFGLEEYLQVRAIAGFSPHNCRFRRIRIWRDGARSIAPSGSMSFAHRGAVGHNTFGPQRGQGLRLGGNAQRMGVRRSWST